MPERCVRPPLLAREALPAWRGVRLSPLVALVVLGLPVLLAVAVLRQLTGATAQDPGVEALSAVLGAARR